MHNKKELIIIIIIIIVTLFMAFLPIMIDDDEEEVITTTASNVKSIDITIEGEIIVPGNGVDDDSIANTITITMPYGTTYGEILLVINNYFTEYSIVDDYLKTRYYEDTTIIIESSYVEEIPVIDNTEGKIVISKATFDELTTLYGIGEKRAQIIIEYRANKPIESFDELKSILGVSDAIIDIIKEKAIL